MFIKSLAWNRGLSNCSLLCLAAKTWNSAADVHSEKFRLSICSKGQEHIFSLSSGGNSAADVHSKNFCKKLPPEDIINSWKFCNGWMSTARIPQSQALPQLIIASLIFLWEFSLSVWGKLRWKSQQSLAPRIFAGERPQSIIVVRKCSNLKWSLKGGCWKHK